MSEFRAEVDAPANGGINTMPMPSLASDNPPDLTGPDWAQVDDMYWVCHDGRVWSLYAGGHWLNPIRISGRPEFTACDGVRIDVEEFIRDYWGAL